MKIALGILAGLVAAFAGGLVAYTRTSGRNHAHREDPDVEDGMEMITNG